MSLRDEAIDIVTVSYRSGATLHEIAQTFGVSHTTIWRWLRHAGIPIRPRGRPKRPMVSVGRTS